VNPQFLQILPSMNPHRELRRKRDVEVQVMKSIAELLQ
jgi:hypothetical protein